jgi:large subunit ribosomal protein L25
MSTTKSLTATKRDGTGKGVARKLRMRGRVPAVIYGRGMESVHLSLDAREVEILFHTISVENTIVELKIEGEASSHLTLVREIQSDPVKSNLVHIDFYRVQSDVAVDVEVPLDLIGIPAGVRLTGGVLEQVIHSLPVKCLPTNIPQSIEVDVTHLEMDQVMHVGDLKIPESLTVTIDSSLTVCLVAAPRGAIEEAAAEPVEGAEPAVAAEPEVIGRADKDKEKDKDKEE